MWTALWVTITASMLTLRSMTGLVGQDIPTPPKKQKGKHDYINYLVSEAEKFPEILIHLLKQITGKIEVTVEIIVIEQKIEFIIHLPPDLPLSSEVRNYLIPMSSAWDKEYKHDYVVDDSESISNTPLAHQFIIRRKTHNIVFITTRGLKKRPLNYLTSGIDKFKWERFVNKISDDSPDIITHDRLFTLIQEKVMTY